MLDANFRRAAEALDVLDGTDFPIELAPDVNLAVFDAWAASKLGAGCFAFVPNGEGSTRGCALWTAPTDDLESVVGVSILEQLQEQMLALGTRHLTVPAMVFNATFQAFAIVYWVHAYRMDLQPPALLACHDASPM